MNGYNSRYFNRNFINSFRKSIDESLSKGNNYGIGARNINETKTASGRESGIGSGKTLMQPDKTWDEIAREEAKKTVAFKGKDLTNVKFERKDGKVYADGIELTTATTKTSHYAKDAPTRSGMAPKPASAAPEQQKTPWFGQPSVRDTNLTQTPAPKPAAAPAPAAAAPAAPTRPLPRNLVPADQGNTTPITPKDTVLPLFGTDSKSVAKSQSDAEKAANSGSLPNLSASPKDVARDSISPMVPPSLPSFIYRGNKRTSTPQDKPVSAAPQQQKTPWFGQPSVRDTNLTQTPAPAAATTGQSLRDRLPSVFFKDRGFTKTGLDPKSMKNPNLDLRTGTKIGDAPTTKFGGMDLRTTRPQDKPVDIKPIRELLPEPGFVKKLTMPS